MRNKKEHDMQVAFFNWVRLERKHAPSLYIREAMELCYAVPNGANLPKRLSKKNEWWSPEAKKMKAEGMEKGMPDINLDVQSMKFTDYIGLRIEHKNHAKPSKKIMAEMASGNRIVELSKEQRLKRELLIKHNYCYLVSYSVEQSVKAVFDYLDKPVSAYSAIKNYL